jgi:hypothetical protein
VNGKVERGAGEEWKRTGHFKLFPHIPKSTLLSQRIGWLSSRYFHLFMFFLSLIGNPYSSVLSF